MPPDEISNLPPDFVKKMEAGEFDGRFSEEVGKLSKEQLEELALILTMRDGKGRRRLR